MKLLLFAAATILVFQTHAKDTYVHGYTKTDGTFVKPHYRTHQNDTTADNYSTQGNVNPYTGASGTKPYKPDETNQNLPSSNTKPYKGYGQ